MRSQKRRRRAALRGLPAKVRRKGSKEKLSKVQSTRKPHFSPSDPFGQEEPLELAPPPYEAPKSRREKLGKKVNPFGDDEDSDGGDIAMPASPPAQPRSVLATAQILPDVEEGDIAATLEDMKISDSKTSTAALSSTREGSTLAQAVVSGADAETIKPTNAAEVVKQGVREEGPKQSEALPGVSTALSKTDQNVTLDIRWTVVSAESGYGESNLASFTELTLASSSYVTCSFS
jgi:hypothetical protein